MKYETVYKRLKMGQKCEKEEVADIEKDEHRGRFCVSKLVMGKCLEK